MEQQGKFPNLERGCIPLSVASIGCVGVIIAALIPAVFAFIAGTTNNRGNSTNPVIVQPPAGASSERLTVEIDGPLYAQLGQRTYYTIVSSNASRLVWSISGFDFDSKNQVDNVSPSHEIWVEPTDATRVGDTFTIQATVYAGNGNSETATKQFILVSE